MDLAEVNANLNTLGVVAPESGIGIYNTSYIQDGAALFRKINGVCFFYFDITINPVDIWGAILVSGLPACSLDVHKNTPTVDNSSSTLFYINNSALKSAPGKSGRYVGYFVYPTF